MLEAKPPSPGSGTPGVGAAAHIHLHRRWAAPLLASVLLSSLLISASFFFSSSRALLLSFSPLPSAASAEPLFVEAKLRQQMRDEERPPRGAVPRIAYLVSGSAGDGAALRRTLRALYHPANTYVVHLDLEAPAAERAELAAAVRADPVYSKFRNVKVVTRANLVTYRGPTMVANTLHAAAILLREGGDWDWFVNLSASDYPLVTQDDLLHVLSELPRQLNFIEHTSDIGWKEYQRAKPVIIDPGLYSLQKSDVFWITEKRSVPTAFKLFTDGQAQSAVAGEVHGVHAHREEAGAGFVTRRGKVGAGVHADQVRARLGLTGRGRGAGFDACNGHPGDGVLAGLGVARSSAHGQDVAGVHAAPVRTRLGLAGRGRGAGFDACSGQARVGVHAGRVRARLGLTGRGRGDCGVTSSSGHLNEESTNDKHTNEAEENHDAEEHTNGHEMSTLGEDREEDHAQIDEVNVEHGEAGHEMNQGGNVSRNKQHTDEEKRAIYALLLHRTSFGVLKRGVTAAVAAETGVPLRTVQRIWKNGRDGGVLGVVSKKPNNYGRKRIGFMPETIKDIPLHKRTTLKDMACEMHMSKTTLFRRLKEGKFRRHTNAIKFTLTAENKKARVRFCLNMLDPISLPHAPTFQAMYNIIYIDEKWFYRTKQTQKCYLALDEEDPERTTQSKNFIEKVMFLAAVARPRFDMDGNMTFDGKIGIFPFTFVEPAQRSSANRARGTLVTKVLPSVTKDVSRDYIVNKLLPAIKEKWPVEEHGTPIFIQQDNAKTHIAVDDPTFVHAASSDGFDIRLMLQPPNSPDLNILDLGFFAALQALFQKSCPNGIEDIVAKVLQAFDEYPVERSNRIFLTHQSCMREIIRLKGGQHYKVPHLRKQVLERHGDLPIRLQCDASIVNEAIEYLS